MVSSYSSRFRLNYQAPGDNLNTWGLTLNSGVFQLLEDALAKRVAFTLSGAKTLVAANGLEDEARCGFLDVTGGSGGTITIPSVEKWYIVRNAASAEVVITTGAGEVAKIATGSVVLVICDAANVRLMRDADMASRAYVLGIAFGSVGDLPDVTGNPGKFVYSDGASASWKHVAVTDVTDLAADLTNLQTIAARAKRYAFAF